MKISTSHQRFANRLRNQRALEHPEEFLGPNWKDVLNFWIFLDTLTKEQRKIIFERYCALNGGFASYRAAYGAAIEATNGNIVNHALPWYASKYYDSSSYATCELIGSHILKAQGKSLVFFPLFLNV